MSRLRLSHCVAVLAASGLLFGIAGTANAKLIGFNGTLSLRLGTLPPFVATGSGTALHNASAGIGGLITIGGFQGGGFKFSIFAQPWTIKTAVVTGLITPDGTFPGGPFSTLTDMGFAHGPQSATSSTAAVSGVIQLVTATRVSSILGVTLITPLFATLRIHLVPEPGTFLLFGSGVVALGIAGRSRRRKK